MTELAMAVPGNSWQQKRQAGYAIALWFTAVVNRGTLHQATSVKHASRSEPPRGRRRWAVFKWRSLAGF
jgi:hypothetical protein